MATTKKRAAPKKDPRKKLSKAERKAIDPPPIERHAFEELVGRLLAGQPEPPERKSKRVRR